MVAPLESLAKELTTIVEVHALLLSSISEAEAGNLLPDRPWSRKHLLGHLIDSAVNNHQRYIRAQLSPHVDLPGYQQDNWVRLNGYEQEAWSELILLWKSFNLHLAHVLARIPEGALNNTISLDSKPPMTLQFVAEDYLRHLKHHLQQMKLE